VLQWLAAGLLAVVAAGLGIEAAWGEGAEPAAEASVGQSGQIIAVAGKITPETHGLYLIDLKNGTVSVYQYLSGSHKLRLMASRNYTFDVQLDEYNTEPPVKDIRKLVQEHKRVADEKK
jgi:hypothetical protein